MWLRTETSGGQPLRSVRCEESLDQLKNYQLVKKHAATWSWRPQVNVSFKLSLIEAFLVCVCVCVWGGGGGGGAKNKFLNLYFFFILDIKKYKILIFLFFFL
jgi:hypothetical protein